MTRSIQILLLIGIAVALTTTSAWAQQQSMRADRAFYAKVGPGFSDYSGDFDPKPFDFNEFDGSGTDGFPWEVSAELGYQFSPGFALGTGYRLGNFPLVENNIGSNPIRHTAMLMTRYTLGGAVWRLAPYADLGGNLTFGGESVGYGPSGGLGLDLALNERSSIYLESRTHWTFDDEALDGADTGNSFDAATTLLGVGFKYTFAPRERAPQVLALDGPASVETGSAATYTATLAPKATEPVTYRWSFGDGTTGTGATASHTYRRPGTYTVSVDASNSAGTDTRTMQTVAEPRPARIVAMNATPNPATTGQPVAFSSTVEGDDVTRSWDFGDGTTGSGAAPTHTYGDAGTYTATLTASNARGTVSRTTEVKVEQALAAICMTVSDFNIAYFARNASVLTTDAEASLRDNVEVLAQCDNLNVRIEGFATTTERDVDQLAADRARAVGAFYEDNGIAASRIETMGRGAVLGQTSKKGGDSQLRRAVSTPVRVEVSVVN